MALVVCFQLVLSKKDALRNYVTTHFVIYVVVVVLTLINSQFNAVRARRTGSNISGVEEIPQVKNRGNKKTKNKL